LTSATQGCLPWLDDVELTPDDIERLECFVCLSVARVVTAAEAVTINDTGVPGDD